MSKTLTFEEPIVKLREKIMELEEFTATNWVDLSDEIGTLKNRLEKFGTRDLWQHGTLGSCSSCQTSRAPDNFGLYKGIVLRISSNCMVMIYLWR